MQWWDGGVVGWWHGGQGAHLLSPGCPHRLGDGREERNGKARWQSSMPALPWGSPQLCLSKKNKDKLHLVRMPVPRMQIHPYFKD